MYFPKPLSLAVVLLLVFALPGCATGGACLDDSTPPEQVRSIYIVKRGQHTGIAIASADWPDRNWSVLADFGDSEYLEFGWGEERYYQAERETLWLGLRAALWPNSSVIHVIGLRSPVVDNAHADAVVEVHVTADGLRRMAEGIEREFTERAPVATPVSLSVTPKPNRFYSAWRRFFFPHMCNWWLATRLEEANCPVAPWSVVTAGQIMRRARSFESAAKD